MRAKRRGRRCRRCGDPIQWRTVRLVGARLYCTEACAILALADEAERTAWTWAALAMRLGPRRGRARLALPRWHAARAQHRLDRRLAAGPRAEILPWIWVPPPCAIAVLGLTLLVWGSTGGGSPEAHRMGLMPPLVRIGHPGEEIPGAPQEMSRLDHMIPQGTRPEGRRMEAALASVPPAVARAAVPPVRPRPLPLALAEDFTRGSRSLPEIAFTFDGHGEANVAGEILDIFLAKGVRVTLFLTGQSIRKFPDLVRRMVAEGHEIANHLDTHPHLTTYARNHRHETLPGVTREFLVGELRRAEASFQAVAGRTMAPYWRAPYGEQNSEIRAWAAEAGYRHIGWTRGAGTAEDLDTRDWVADTSSPIYRSREEIATRILDFGGGHPGALSGGIVLMHLNTHRQTDRPHEALPHLLRSLQDQGYHLVTVSELLDHGVAQHARRAAKAIRQHALSVQAFARE